MTQQRFFLKLTLKKNEKSSRSSLLLFWDQVKNWTKNKKMWTTFSLPHGLRFLWLCKFAFFWFLFACHKIFFDEPAPPPHIRFDATCLVSRFYCFVWKRKMIAIHGREYSREFRIRYLVLLLSYSVNFYYRNKHLSNNLQF